MAIHSNSVKTAFPENGINRSEVFSTTMGNIVDDIQNLTRFTNSQEVDLNTTNETLSNNLLTVVSSLKTLEKSQESIQKNSSEYIQTLNFYDKKNISYAEGTLEENKLYVNQKFGNVSLPAFNYTPVFYNEDTDTGNIVEDGNILLSVESISSETDTVAGISPVVNPGTPRNAFNGQNAQSWIHTHTYPLEAQVSQVSVSIEAVLPASTDLKSFNVLNIIPFAEGSIDILSIEYKATPSSSYALLESFPSSVKPGNSTPTADVINNSDSRQYVGKVRSIHSIKVELRQRNWKEVNNKKVFTIGLQELDLKNIAFSNANSSYSSNLKDNNHVILKVDAPSDRLFSFITRLNIDPLANLEGSVLDSNHVVAYINNTPDLVDYLWSSYENLLPQTTTRTSDNRVVIDANSYYIIFLMKYVNDITSDNSPFAKGTTPVLKEVVVTNSIKSTGLLDSVGDPADTLDWGIRNWALHKFFEGNLDFYRGSLVGNVSVFGDDFWNDVDHRASIENSTSEVEINDELMSLTTSSQAFSLQGSIDYRPIDVSTIGYAIQSIRVQSVQQQPENSSVVFKFNYTTDDSRDISNGTIVEVSVNATTDALNSWIELPTGLLGTVTSFTLTVELNNSSLGDKPLLGQFILLMRD